MFEEAVDNFFEPESSLLVNGPIFLAKENNVTSEQTFLVVVQVSSSVPQGQGIQPATLDADYNLGGRSVRVLPFGPLEQRINFPFRLFTDTLPEGTEAFLASSAPGHTGQLPDGTTVLISTFLNPIALSAETFVIIEDDDCEFTYSCASTES